MINPGDEPAAITIEGRDDTGAAATGGTVQLTLPAGGARTLTAQQLEAGDSGPMGQTDQTGGTGQADRANLTGRLGAGAGRWRLSLSSDRLIQAVNVVTATSGYMVNLSTTAVEGAAPVDHEAFTERFGTRGIEYLRGEGRSTFTAQAGDRFASRCTGGDNPDGFWSGGSWSTVEPDETMPDEPTGMAQESNCYPGLLVGIGASCTYPGTTDEFTVNVRGRGRFLDSLAGIRIRLDNETIGGRVYDFEASHQGDGVWLIDRVAGMTAEPSFGAATAPDDQTYTVGTAIETLTLREATGGNGTLRYSLSPDVPGLTFDAGTRQLTGTPSTAGVYDMIYTVADADGDTDTLGFTITVEGGDDGGGTDGGADTGPSRDVSVEDIYCDATRVDSTSVRVDVAGTVRAHRQLFNVRVAGYLDGEYLGADFLGDIPAGGTRSFAVAGNVTTITSDSTCTVRVFFNR